MFHHIVKPIRCGVTLQRQKTRNLLYIILYIISLIYTIAPLLISIYSLFNETHFDLILTSWIGLFLAFLGRGISITCSYLLNHNISGQLVENSLFKWSRNPISFGLYLTFFGLLLIFQYPVLIAGWILFVINIDFKIRIEEKWLEEKWGEKYKRYKQSTPKYILI